MRADGAWRLLLLATAFAAAFGLLDACAKSLPGDGESTVDTWDDCASSIRVYRR